MQSIHKPLLLALALLPVSLFSETALAGGLKLFINSGHYSDHGHHYSYRTRPGFALSYYRTGNRYHGRSHYSHPRAYSHYKSYSRSYGYRHHKPSGHYGYRHGYHGNHGDRNGYYNGYRHNSHSRHHGSKRNHCLGRHC